MIKQYYSISELLTLDIPSFPKTAFGMQKKAERECWKSQMRNKLGGGKEYLFDSLPDSAKDYILSKQIGTSSDIVKVETSVQKLPIDINELKPYQRDVIDARALILKELDQLSTVYGGINNAICKFQELINADELNEDLKNALVRANAKSGGRPVKISRATIFNWRKAVKENGTILALAQKEIKEAEWPAWGDALLKLWQRPQKPSLASCLETLNKNLPATEMPSYSAAQRFLKKLPPLIFNKGRYGSRELKKFKAYVSRDTSKLWPTAVYTADGHTFDAEVRNPLSGKAFRPEITTVIDVYTRKVVGWSIDLSERTNSVYMALARSIITHGIPSIWYVDNGKGFNNRCFDDDMVGLFARLGIEKQNSIAYNSQARGIGERIHQTIWVRASKELATYMGIDMDAQAKQAVFKKTRHDIKNIGSSKLLMEWNDFKKFCAERVDYYNNQPHSSLPYIYEIIDGQNKRRNMTPTEFWDKCERDGFVADKLTNNEIKDLYRYYEVRKTTRGLVSLFNNNYFSNDLLPFHGQDVAVAFDVCDASKVWVRELVEYNGEVRCGRLIAEAIFNANARGYFPESKMEALSRKRVENRIKRLESHKDDAEDELKNRFLEFHQMDIEEYTTLPKAETKEIPQFSSEPKKEISSPKQIGERPVFSGDVEWAQWILDHPDEITQQDKEILSTMLKKPEVVMLFEVEDVNVNALLALIKEKGLTTAIGQAAI